MPKSHKQKWQKIKDTFSWLKKISKHLSKADLIILSDTTAAKNQPTNILFDVA